MGSNKQWIVHNLFKGLSAAIIKKIEVDVAKGGYPFLGTNDEEEARFKIDELFENCIKNDIVYEYSEGWLEQVKHEYLEKIFDELDYIIDDCEKRYVRSHVSTGVRNYNNSIY